MGDITPTRRYRVNLCECLDARENMHLHVSQFYERGEDHAIRCANCGNVPPTVGDGKVPASHRIEIEILSHVEDGTPDGTWYGYKEVLYPDA